MRAIIPTVTVKDVVIKSTAKYRFVSRPLYKVKGRVLPAKKGATYAAGRNAAKRANRQADIRARVAARSAR